MTRFLVFTLAAPLMSFGDVAPGERRVSFDRPSRSALIGLIAAALGLWRDDSRQAGLADSFAFAVRVDASGRRLTDYHTTQTAPARKNRRFATRREELLAEDLGTILSQRAYLTDAAFTIVALDAAPGPFSLDDIAGALMSPKLPIHAGRRACPLGLPPNPFLTDAPTVPEAFAAYDARENTLEARACLRRLYGLAPEGPAMVALDDAFEQHGLLGTIQINRRETRRDVPVDRLRWQFSLRNESVGHLLRSDKGGEVS